MVDRADADAFIKDFGAFGLELYPAAGQRLHLSIIDLTEMIKDHHQYPVDNLYAGIAMTIKIEGIPLSGGFFGVAAFDTVAADRIVGTKAAKLARWRIDIFAIGLPDRRDLRRAACTAPIIATVSLLDLEFVGAHPGAPIGAIGSDGMVEQAAVLFFALFLPPGESAPFEQHLQMIIGIFLFADQSSDVLPADADHVLISFGYDAEDAVRVFVEADGLIANAFAGTVGGRGKICVPAGEVFSVEKGTPA